MITRVSLVAAFATLGAVAADLTIALDRTDQLEVRGLKSQVVEYRGRRALELTDARKPGENPLAMLKNVTMRDGAIEIDMAGAPAADAGEGARGFVGIAFRVAPDAQRFEYIYLRPTNGRADDQVRRNHSVQYASHPDYPWERLRKEEPEKYETYADLETGAWTKVRIVVSGPRARLYLNGAAQPTLIVNDLKLGNTDGGIALWVGPGTQAHFAELKVSKTD